MGPLLQSSINNRNLFQWLAVLTMVIDHVGAFFLPQFTILRIVGRIACPIYMFLAVQSYDKCSYRPEYLLRLFLLGCAAQISYGFLVPGHVNMILSMLLCYIPYMLFKSGRVYLSFIIVAGLSFLALDYPAWFIFCSFVIFSMRSAIKIAFSFIILSIVLSVITRSDISSFHAVFIVLLFVPTLDFPAIPAKLWRWFYPGHLVVILIFKSCLKYFNI